MAKHLLCHGIRVSPEGWHHYLTTIQQHVQKTANMQWVFDEAAVNYAVKQIVNHRNEMKEKVEKAREAQRKRKEDHARRIAERAAAERARRAAYTEAMNNFLGRSRTHGASSTTARVPQLAPHVQNLIADLRVPATHLPGPKDLSRTVSKQSQSSPLSGRVSPAQSSTLKDAMNRGLGNMPTSAATAQSLPRHVQHLVRGLPRPPAVRSQQAPSVPSSTAGGSRRSLSPVPTSSQRPAASERMSTTAQREAVWRQAMNRGPGNMTSSEATRSLPHYVQQNLNELMRNVSGSDQRAEPHDPRGGQQSQSIPAPSMLRSGGRSLRSMPEMPLHMTSGLVARL